MTADPTFAAGERLPASKLVALSPDPTAFTPVWTNLTTGTTGYTNTGYYWYVGRQVHYVISMTIGTGGSFSSTVEVDFPTTADATLAAMFVPVAWGAVSGGARYAGTALCDANGIIRIATDGSTAWDATYPGTWAAGSNIIIQGSYIEA